MDVIGIGIPYFDMVINVDELPHMDGATTANAVFNQGGGKVATAMATAARLGKHAGMIARVGHNRSGRFIINDLKYNGVDVGGILVDQIGTSSSFCLSLSEKKSQKRIFIGTKGTAKTLQPEDIDYDYLGKARILQVESGDDASVAAIRFAKEKGIKTVMDADNYSWETQALSASVDVVIASEFFYQGMFGGLNYEEGCRRMIETGPEVAVVTLGSKGCVGMERGKGFFHCPCFEVNVVDTTGAGDVFHGAYIAAMLDGMETEECARFASAVSAIKCTYPGGRTGIPDRNTVDQFLTTGKIDNRELEERYLYYRNNI